MREIRPRGRVSLKGAKAQSSRRFCSWLPSFRQLAETAIKALSWVILQSPQSAIRASSVIL
jgi:hypothetical protein